MLILPRLGRESLFSFMLRNRTGSRNNLLFYSCPREALGPSPLRSSNPLKMNFAAVFEFNKIDELKTVRNGKNKLKLTQE